MSSMLPARSVSMMKGVFTALVTPFNRDGSIDVGAYKALIQFQMEQGIDGLVPVGTTGESPTLSEQEKELLIQLAVELAQKKIPVIAGTGSNNTSHAIDATKRAKEDRKSTRLNSSHVRISYAVFCLKKKKTCKQLLTLPQKQ